MKNVQEDIIYSNTIIICSNNQHCVHQAPCKYVSTTAYMMFKGNKYFLYRPINFLEILATDQEES